MRRWAVALVCVAAHVLSVRPGGPPETSAALETAAAVAGIAGGIALLWRVEAPGRVLAGSTLAYGLQVALAGPVPPVAPAVAVYGATRRLATPRGPLAVAGAAVAVTAVLLATGRGDLAPLYVAALLGAGLAGIALATSAARTEAARREAAHGERLRIARELHDVVGHGMSAITVQAGAARMAIEAGQSQDAGRALEHIEAAGRSVLRDVRWLVGLLREEPGAPSLADLDRLADGARRAGLPVQLEVTGDIGQVEPSVGEAAYRVVQEALTNVLRHAEAREAAVRVVADGGGVTVTVLDDGRGGDAVAGTGLRGMRERAEAVGATVEAGARADGRGWSVCFHAPAGRRR